MGTNMWRPRPGAFRVAIVAAGVLLAAGLPTVPADAQTGPQPDTATVRPSAVLLPAYYARAFDVAWPSAWPRNWCRRA